MRRPDGAKPVRAVARDERHVRERLDVADEGRAVVDAALERSRRHGRRQRGLAVDVGDRGGLLAADVAARRRDDAQGGPAVARRAALVDGAQRRGPHPRVRALDVEHHLVGADRGGGDHGAVDHEVRRVGEQDGVLAAGRLALRAVGDDHGPAPPARDGAQLEGAGDVSAAAPAQPAALDRVEQPGARVAAGRLEGAVDADVLGQGQRPAALDPAQEPRKAARAAHHATSCASAVPTTAPAASILRARRSWTGRAPGDVRRATTRSPRSPTTRPR